MKFHGRVAPGRLTDLSKPLQILIYAPAKLADVTLKVWEMDTFEQDGKTTSEGTADDLLATFRGEITPASGNERPPEWRAFKVSDAKIEDAEPDVIRVKIQFGGDDKVYEVPIKSELDEVEGDSYEIGFSIEVGGAEKFKTKSPALVIPPMRPLRVVARYGQHANLDGVVKDTMYDEPIAYRYIAIGTRTTQDEKAKLKILATGYTDGAGYLFDRDPSVKAGEPARPLIVRAGRELFLLEDVDPITQNGATNIPIVMCDAIVGDDHDLLVYRNGTNHPMSLRIAERPATGDREFGEAKAVGPALPALSSLFRVGSKKNGAGG